MKHREDCKINFGDCPDCEHFKEMECQYNEKKDEEEALELHLAMSQEEIE